MPEELQPRFVHNASGRFESRWSTVKVRRRRVAALVRVFCVLCYFFSLFLVVWLSSLPGWACGTAVATGVLVFAFVT